MLKQDLLRLIADSPLPPELRAYLARAAAARTPSAVKTALRRGAPGFLARVARLVAGAAAALGLTEAEVCFATGFKPADLGPERFEALLAELAALLWLAEGGYTGLRLLPQGAARGADISARLDGKEYFFEVRCLRPDPGLLADKAYIRQKVEKKMRQVKTSCKRHGGHCGGVILVVDPANTILVTGYLIQDCQLIEISRPKPDRQ